MSTDQIWDLERSFWLDGVPTYEASLHEKAVMALPGVGILDRSAIIESIRQVPRWSEVQMTGRRTITADGVTILAYSAEATREGAPAYNANCISTYVRQSEGWHMLSHQQTPA